MTEYAQLQQLLDTTMGDNDAYADTVGDYFICLAEQTWIEEEGFNGKRPFGNSGWKSEVYTALRYAGLMAAEDENDPYASDYDEEDRIDKLLIRALEKARLVVR